MYIALRFVLATLTGTKGFGVAWYRQDLLHKGSCVFKLTTPAWNTTNLLHLSEFVESSLIFGHVRAASNIRDDDAQCTIVGRISQENCHPFKYNRYTFMHNGGIPKFSQMKRRIIEMLDDEVRLRFHANSYELDLDI
jgi:predicted glutamine amidotransferase